ncbi:hypothetical protein A1Q1_05177 [Trichosporon asahii var. asahii CBS 2479]|uniref:DUF4110 domain-containing protein n=1 Tax=Trichosporon asahii var. asahii (strain ATCC 90039 / CBS 2479 / JCM 2466 / KCTC 7840 / NBRC 103889/ NCYC 2677 / UAMH 7654) TaxID=1186058 RepID=J4U7E4_TRIAS|nr:hypothetical protein A1Q1_05177 [Trichosporon asahii var. asahii CBS 2479]EJT46220.1 hypothetical protein A1Q1_05177 [Trichosporon asahii var. asahii CBS 2479]
MGKTKSGGAGKAAAKAAKKEKQAEKAAKKEQQALKAATKGKAKGAAADDDEEDLDAILERYKQEMEADEWREYKCGTAPSPRSSAAAVAGPGLAEGGGIMIFANYMSDLWVFDLDTYKWHQIEHIDKDRAPGGFSFIPCPEGAFLYGGYRKEYVKGTRPKGVPLDDAWLLRMDPDLSKLKWERRKKVGYAPSLRSGCSMTHWASKGMGVLFGGVIDEEKDEESMESIFFNDLLMLKKKKKPGARRRAKKVEQEQEQEEKDDEDMDVDGEDEKEKEKSPLPSPAPAPMAVDKDDDDDDPQKSIPLTRYNAMLAILKNTLYLWNHLRGTGLDELEWKGSDDEEGFSGSDDDEEESSDDEEEEEEALAALEDAEDDEEAKEARHAALSQAEKDDLRKKAKAFSAAAKEKRTEEEMHTTPLPGENLRMFYERTRPYWAGIAYERTASRGKAMRREGFQLASSKYEEYKPLLEEIERIQREAELDAAAVAASKRTTMGVIGEGGRNRR